MSLPPIDPVSINSPLLTRCGHVALAGAPNVGKSTLLNALVGEHLAIVSPKPQATRLPVLGLRTTASVQYVFHDLPGLLDPATLLHAAMRRAAIEALYRADVVLHLHPAPAGPAGAFDGLVPLDRPLQAPVLQVYTMADRLRQAGVKGLGGQQLLVSGKTGLGVQTLLARVGALLPEGPFQYDPENLGAQPLRFFVGEYLREAAFDLLDDELPYAVTAEVEEFREDARPVYIRATLFVERESQRGILIGRRGQMLKALGSHARRRLEVLTGSPIYLDTRVKVLKDWRRRPAMLEALGFPTREKTPPPLVAFR